jgi:hypothetical protein
MTTYRVGQAGATVFNEDGKAIARLRPGYVVVEGTIDTARVPDEHHDEQAKRVGRYADKKLRPVEDKARPTPAPRPDPRLSNCVLEGGRSKVYPEAEPR